MNKKKDIQNINHSIMSFQEDFHQQNQRRIKGGLKCLYIVPAIFLFLMFLSGSSKLVFLILWIVSLFILAVYLVTVEYMDYSVQNILNEFSGDSSQEIQQLLETPRIGERLSAVKSKKSKQSDSEEKVQGGEEE